MNRICGAIGSVQRQILMVCTGAYVSKVKVGTLMNRICVG